MLASALVSAGINLFIAGVPTGIYWLVQRLRHKRSHREILTRLGFCRPNGEVRMALLFLAAGIIWIAFRYFTTPIEELANEGSPLKPFVGAKIGFEPLAASFLYGVIQTGFAEELLFRGLIAGSLGRRFSIWKANLLQAIPFTVMHLPVLFFLPDEWLMILVVPTIGGLMFGWLRIKTGSLLWPWILHGGANWLLALLVWLAA